MALSYRRDDSGLVLAEEAMDESRVSRALKQVDDRLVLQKERWPAAPGWRYEVLRVWSDSHPAAHVCYWQDEHGTPLPLTSGLIDRVHTHLLGFRGGDFYVDEADHNRAHLADLERRQREAHEAVVADHLPRLSGRISVSMSGPLRRRRHDSSPSAPLAHEEIR